MVRHQKRGLKLRIDNGGEKRTIKLGNVMPISG